MGIFSKRGPSFAPGTEGPTVQAQRTISGKPVVSPEVAGTFERRSRFFGSALSLAGHNEGPTLTAKINELFTQERALQKWVALRGALAFLNIACNEAHQTSYEALLQVTDDQVVPKGLERALAQYSRLENMSTDRVLADPMFGQLGSAWALSCIAWTAAAFVKSGMSEQLAGIPEPSQLTQPGWYTDPLFAKCDRYWDGSDWSVRCRALEGNRWESVRSLL